MIIFGFGAILPPQSWPAGKDEPHVSEALKEMADLEARIDRAHRQQFEGQRRLLEANRSLQSVKATLQQKTQLDKEGEAFLQTYGERARNGLAATGQQRDAGLREVDAARTGLNLASAALLARGSDTRADNAELLALALLQSAQRDRARIASKNILDLESRASELAGRSEHAQRSARLQSVFSEVGLKQLRERHEVLARQVAEAQARSDRESQEVRQLANRHEQLKGLIGRLAALEAARVASATPEPTPGTVVPPPVAHPAVSPPPVATPVMVAAATTPGPAAGATLGEVPYESGSEPMVSAMRGGQDQDQTDPSGTRYLFWRARPVGVRALAAGKVIFSAPFAGYRHLLILDHGGGWRALYGNMTQCSLTAGGKVQPGQVLGQYQASQGSHAEPLWFEVRNGVQAVAPATWPAIPNQWQSHLLRQVEP